MLIQFGQRDITPSVVAHVLGMMAKAPSALSDQPGQVNNRLLIYLHKQADRLDIL